ncbi:MAG TPA: SlyX protein [Alteromonas australica]|jgi:SlyX protein|uniref:Protein SlyX homolog n=1 Tax=Alteromonas australica TaxID=589873 RepID=A0A075P4E7_9ALTE|nr:MULTISPECIES: SlyX family protein [Alteromonas]MAB93866.1 SlyX protein [Alteromonas sp.]AIG00549.1 SlyX [Alteromonas australica]AJP45411.1 SlyX [Alteromonas australica]MAF69053.1 SlyX protein [Alteromonas sp.]MAF72117.1 SlyX protein [Alteromonas sp.]|tara:strand:- start:312 stop:563 length:252 start_codon:yes stop_codon:yes gene_type:complete
MSENKREEALSEALAIANNNIEELQTKVAFQEHTIEALNEALASQQKQLEDLHYKVRHVIDRVKSIQPSNIAKQSEEMPPPHY